MRAPHPKKIFVPVPDLSALTGEPMNVVLDFCTGGSLIEFLRTRGAELDLGMKNHMAAEILDAMDYLSSCSIVHRDLACRNVLLMNTLLCKVRYTGWRRVCWMIVAGLQQPQLCSMPRTIPWRKPLQPRTRTRTHTHTHTNTHTHTRACTRTI